MSSCTRPRVLSLALFQRPLAINSGAVSVGALAAFRTPPRRYFERSPYIVSDTFGALFRALFRALSVCCFRHFRALFRAEFRALRGHLRIVSGTISAHSWVWLRSVSSGMPSAIKHCTEDVISSTVLGAISDATSVLYRVVLGAVPSTFLSAVLVRVRAPSRAHFRTLSWRYFGRCLGVVSGDTSVLLQAPVQDWFMCQFGAILGVSSALFCAPFQRRLVRNRGTALGTVGARLWAPSGRGFGRYRGAALGAIGVRL